ncbi:hypothetical protein [Legionella gresilensis]|uniref:hypothetical protein n=1 Tax=Legionella gresilensis TaxID=91823 RepID=UPI001040F0D0|nr:hypothetical protein [Legionella gresilensis]
MTANLTDEQKIHMCFLISPDLAVIIFCANIRQCFSFKFIWFDNNAFILPYEHIATNNKKIRHLALIFDG